MILKAIRNEDGVILLSTIILSMVFLLLSGMVTDFMRAFVVKRELQDALDAAVISAAQSELAQSRSKYSFEVGTRECTTKKDPKTGKSKRT